MKVPGPVNSDIPKQAVSGKFSSIKKWRVELEHAPAPTTKSLALSKPISFFILFKRINFLN